MISIRTKGPGDGNYYTDVSSAADYYNPATPGEAPGQWLETRAAKVAGFTGQLSKDVFLAACNGFTSDGTNMRQNAGKERAQAFTDLTVSDPKGVSVFEALVDDRTRAEIQKCRDAAIRVVVDELEKLAVARLGKAGQGGKIGGSIVVAAFKHLTSRALDVQSHTHLVVQSGMSCTDGKWRAIDWTCLYQKGLKLKLGALYRAEFSYLLQSRLGLELTRINGRDRKETSLFDLKAMHGQFKRLLDDLSKRRAQVLARLAEKGVGYSAKEAAKAVLESRTRKGHLSENEVRERTRDAALGHGLTPEMAAEMIGKAKCVRQDPEKTFVAILKEAVANLTSEHAHFSGVQIEQAVLEAAVCRGLPTATIQERLQATFADPKGPFVAVGPEHARRFTTAGILAEEQKLFSVLDRLKQTKAHECKKSVVDNIIKENPKFTKEQVEALRHLVKGEGLICVDGYAGTEKSRILKEAAKCSRGYDLIGVAVAGKAAEGLEAATSIKSYTLAKLIGSTELKHRGDFEKGFLDDLKHDARMMVRAAKKQVTWSPQRVKLGPNSIVILDEAGMVGTKDFLKLVVACARAGAKLVCVGDADQLPPIGAGAPFRDACQRYDAVSIKSIVRQKFNWHNRCVKLLAHGRPERALREFARRGLINIAKTKRVAINNLVANFAKAGLRDTSDRVALATRNADVELINRKVQEVRRAAKVLGAPVAVKGKLFFQNDRVLFRKNNLALGVKNGTFGTLLAIDERERYIKVCLDGSGRIVTVDIRKYTDISLGYASSVFRSQGVTQKRVFVLGDGIGRQSAYVALSRSEFETKLFLSKEAAGEDLATFVKSLKSDNSKTLATSQLRRQQTARLEPRL